MVFSRGVPPRHALFALSLGAIITLSVAATARACVPFASLRVTPTDVQPGQEVSVTGAQFRPGVPVVIRLDSLDGPELATVMVDSPKGPFFQTTVVIPPHASAGTHVLVATQQPPDWAGPGWGIPARAVITVGQPSPLGPAPPLAPRTADLTRESVGPIAFLLVTLGVAAVTLLGFGGIAVVVSRRAGRRSPARVSS